MRPASMTTLALGTARGFTQSTRFVFVRTVRMPFSLHRNAGRLDDLRPPQNVLLDERTELGRRIAADEEALLCKVLLHVGRVERLDELRVQLRDDLARRSREGEQSLPRKRLEAGIARLGDRRNVRKQRVAPCRSYRERPDPPGANLRQRHQHVIEHQLNLSADEIVERVGGALIRYMHEIGPGGKIEHLARQVHRGALAGWAWFGGGT